MKKEHFLLIRRYNALKKFFEIEEAKYKEQKVPIPYHVMTATTIIRGTKNQTILG